MFLQSVGGVHGVAKGSGVRRCVKLKGNAETRCLTCCQRPNGKMCQNRTKGLQKHCGMDGLSCCVASDADKMSLILILYFNAKVAKDQSKHAANKMQEWEAVKLKGNAETRRLTLLSAMDPVTDVITERGSSKIEEHVTQKRTLEAFLL